MEEAHSTSPAGLDADDRFCNCFVFKGFDRV